MVRAISTTAIILVIVWAVGFIGGIWTNALIHIILGIAFLLFILSFYGKKT